VEVVAGRKTAEAGWSSGASRKMKPTRSNIEATHIISLKSHTLKLGVKLYFTPLTGYNIVGANFSFTFEIEGKITVRVKRRVETQ
jgi:hypothetical protein